MRRKNRYTEKRKRVTPYGQWQYPGEVTTIPDNNITMKGVPYPVLGVSDVGDMKMMMPGMDYVFNGSEVTEYPVMQTGGVPFEEWYKTVPAEKNDTTYYDLRTAYQYLPYSDMVRFANEKDFHLGSVAEMPDGNYRFLKSKDHPTIQKELDWYYGNTPEAKEFRNNYTLDKSSHYYKYVKKKQIGKYLEGNYVQPQNVNSVLQLWNDMMARGYEKGDHIATVVGDLAGLASSIGGAAAAKYGADTGKQNWMKGITTPRQAKKYLTSEQFGKDLAASTADYEDTTEYAELPQEVLQYQQQKRNDDFFRNIPRKDLRDNISAAPIIKQNATINPFSILNGINVENNQSRNTNPINPFNMLPGIHSPNRISTSGYDRYANRRPPYFQIGGNPFMKFATGGNPATLIEAENNEVFSSSTGAVKMNNESDYHERFSNVNEKKKNMVTASNDANREVRENPQLTKLQHHTNPYETIRRIINGEFIFPSTVGLSGILEPRNGDDYWLARWLNGLKGKRQAGGGISKHQTNPFLNPPQVNIPDGMTPEEYFSTLKPSTTRVIDGKVQTIMPWDLDKYETPQDKQIRLNYEINKKKAIEAETQRAIEQAKPKSEDSFYGAYTTNVATPTRSYLDSNLTTKEKNFIADEKVRKARQTAAEESKYIQNIGNETAKLVGSFIPGLNVPILASWFADAANEFKENPNIETASLGLLAGFPFLGGIWERVKHAGKSLPKLFDFTKGISSNLKNPSATIINPETKIDIIQPLRKLETSEEFANRIFDEVYPEVLSYATSNERKELFEKTKREAFNNGYIKNTSHIPISLKTKRPKVKDGGFNLDVEGDYIRGLHRVRLYNINESTAYHEGLHSARVGDFLASNILDDENYIKLSDELLNNPYDKNIAHKLEILEKENIGLQKFFEDKARSVLKHNASEYIKQPAELVVHGLTNGRKLGIKPFSKYPGDEEVKKIISDLDYNEILNEEFDFNKSNSLHDYWNLLTGNFLPSITTIILGGGAAGLYYNTKHK